MSVRQDGALHQLAVRSEHGDDFIFRHCLDPLLHVELAVFVSGAVDELLQRQSLLEYPFVKELGSRREVDDILLLKFNLIAVQPCHGFAAGGSFAVAV